MVIFLHCCFFACNGNYGLSLLTTPTLLLCFCWMHLWWCGVLCVTTLMEESQGVEEEDKEGAIYCIMTVVQHVFSKEINK